MRLLCIWMKGDSRKMSSKKINNEKQSKILLIFMKYVGRSGPGVNLLGCVFPFLFVHKQTILLQLLATAVRTEINK